ncbi:hypothetical protein Axi01nite_04340 [Actinoplanes xinjiangensis]|nr:hypothetical protein Axi01nite_04340 [Actinoplanes xinjiangensis]
MTVRQMLVAGRYRLVEPVGAGGMGRVWLARDEMLHRDVAVKEIVPPGWMSDVEQHRMHERTLREARSAARLNHPHVVRIYDVVHTEGQSWIVMEYVPSRSLYQVLDEDGPYEPAVAARIGLALLDALDAAHRAGVLHRDVKPHNVLIGTDGRVVLTDFGLATFVDDGGVTAPGLIVGSPQYVSPERARTGASTVESDLWSLGATLYAAVEGHSPYARETAMATLAALATDPPDPPARAGPLAAVLDGLLRYEPAARLTVPEVERRLRMIVFSDPREIPFLPTRRGSRPGAARSGAVRPGGMSSPGLARPSGPVPVSGGPEAAGMVAGASASGGAARGEPVRPVGPHRGTAAVIGRPTPQPVPQPQPVPPLPPQSRPVPPPPQPRPVPQPYPVAPPPPQSRPVPPPPQPRPVPQPHPVAPPPPQPVPQPQPAPQQRTPPSSPTRPLGDVPSSPMRPPVSPFVPEVPSAAEPRGERPSGRPAPEGDPLRSSSEAKSDVDSLTLMESQPVPAPQPGSDVPDTSGRIREPERASDAGMDSPESPSPRPVPTVRRPAPKPGPVRGLSTAPPRQRRAEPTSKSETDLVMPRPASPSHVAERPPSSDGPPSRTATTIAGGHAEEPAAGASSPEPDVGRGEQATVAASGPEPDVGCGEQATVTTGGPEPQVGQARKSDQAAAVVQGLEAGPESADTQDPGAGSVPAPRRSPEAGHTPSVGRGAEDGPESPVSRDSHTPGPMATTAATAGPMWVAGRGSGADPMPVTGRGSGADPVSVTGRGSGAGPGSAVERRSDVTAIDRQPEFDRGTPAERVHQADRDTVDPLPGPQADPVSDRSARPPGQALVPVRLVTASAGPRPRRRMFPDSVRVTPARLALTGVVVLLLLGGSLLAGYVAELTGARPRVFVPSPLSTETAQERSTNSASDPVPNSPPFGPVGGSPSTGVPGSPETPAGPPDPNGGESAGSLGPAPASSDPQTTSSAASAFSPSLCDSPPPDGLPVTPLDGSARGVNGWNLQAGWSYFTDGSGFHIAVPNGWTHQRIGTTHCFRGPRNGRTITLDAARDPAADPLAEARAEESRLATSGALPGYTLVGVGQVPLLLKAADWEYRYRSASGSARHAVFRWFVMGGRAYALGWATAEKSWSADLAEVQMIRSTFYTIR